MVERIGNWSYSRILALNNLGGAPVIAPLVTTPQINVTPMLVEFQVDGPDPSGFRHIHTGPVSASGKSESFVAVRASGRGPANLGLGDFDMNATNIAPGSGISCTRVFLFRAEQFDCDTSRLYNLRVWASNTDDFLVPDSFRIVFETQQAWQSGLQFPVNYLLNESKFLPTSLPDNFNLSRQDGGYTIHGSGDMDVSEWIYMAVAASGTLPLGQYGATQASGFLVRVSYELDNIFPLKD